MKRRVEHFDDRTITLLQRIELPFLRIALFTIYFWFGLLKLLGISPAESLVEELFSQTLAVFLPFNAFYTGFALFEMAIGIAFLLKGLERLAIFLVGMHLVVTVLPLFVLPDIAWNGILVPTLEGQYIIKNVLIASLAVVVGARLVPLKKGSR